MSLEGNTNPYSLQCDTSCLLYTSTDALDAVYFYGAGCGFPDKIAMVHRAITKHLRVKGEVEVNTDMLLSLIHICKASAMLYFKTIKEACRAVVAMKKLTDGNGEWTVKGAELLLSLIHI